MEGRPRLDDDEDPLPDWGHTVEHVPGHLQYNAEAWEGLVPYAVDAVNEALRLEREFRDRFNVAEVANLASDLEETAVALHRALLEAYGAAHRSHPGRHNTR